MEVMGLMLGEFVDDYTVSVVDVFAMPQNGTGVSVEAVDAAFQARMLEMLKVTNRCSINHLVPPPFLDVFAPFLVYHVVYSSGVRPAALFLLARNVDRVCVSWVSKSKCNLSV